MKRFLSLLLVISLFMFGGVVNAAEVPALQQIVEKFNNSSKVKELKDAEVDLNARVEENKLIIKYIVETKSFDIEYLLTDNILSRDIDSNSVNILGELLVANVIIDTIGQFHGYNESDMYPTLKDENIKNYTLEKEGLLYKLNDNIFNVKVDLTKKIPLIDFSNTYFEVNDLEELREYISGDGSAEKSKGNIWFNKSGYDGENTLLVAEKEKLTENSYKSILSILEVMFDSDGVVEYFKNNYSTISDNKEFDGFKIEINPEKDEFEKNLIPDNSEYKFLRITIDKDVVNSFVDNDDNFNNNDENVDEIKNNINNEKIENPKTGNFMTIFLLIALMISCIFTILYISKKYNFNQ